LIILVDSLRFDNQFIPLGLERLCQAGSGAYLWCGLWIWVCVLRSFIMYG